MPPRLDEPVRVGCVAEWERRADERVDRVGRPQREQLFGTLAHELRVEAQQPSEVEAEHGRIATDEPLHARVLPETAREADRDDRPEWIQERKRAREDL